MGGTTAQTVLEVTEYTPHSRARLVADSHGTVWDTLYRVEGSGGGTRLTVDIEARAHKLLARLTGPLINPLVKRNVGQDLDEIQAFCERQG